MHCEARKLTFDLSVWTGRVLQVLYVGDIYNSEFDLGDAFVWLLRRPNKL